MKRLAFALFALVCLLCLAGCNLLSIQTPTPFPTLSFLTVQATPTVILPTVTPSTVPTDLPASPTATAVPSSVPTSIPTNASSNTAVPTVTTQSGTPSGPYAVVLVLPGDVLNIRSGPGAGNPVVGTFQPTFTGVMRTGPSAQAGDSLWVEVQRPEGGKGWVNSKFLTEYVAPSSFCADGKVNTLLDNLKKSLNNSDGQLLSSLVSPVHGLDLLFFRSGTVANYSQEEAKWVFQSEYVVNWGSGPSGIDTKGTFRSVPLPELLTVLNSPYDLYCNDATQAGAVEAAWPPEYSNVNFYAIYKPGSPGVEMDWHTWLAGIEYFKGKPTLFALIHFVWEP